MGVAFLGMIVAKTIFIPLPGRIVEKCRKGILFMEKGCFLISSIIVKASVGKWQTTPDKEKLMAKATLLFVNLFTGLKPQC